MFASFQVKVEVAEAGGKCNVHILDMHPGLARFETQERSFASPPGVEDGGSFWDNAPGNVDKKTGEVTFDPQYKA